MCRPTEVKALVWRSRRTQVWRRDSVRASPAVPPSSPASRYCPGCWAWSARWCSRRPSALVAWARRMSPRTRSPTCSMSWSWAAR